MPLGIAYPMLAWFLLLFFLLLFAPVLKLFLSLCAFSFGGNSKAVFRLITCTLWVMSVGPWAVNTLNHASLRISMVLLKSYNRQRVNRWLKMNSICVSQQPGGDGRLEVLNSLSRSFSAPHNPPPKPQRAHCLDLSSTNQINPKLLEWTLIQ